MDALPSPTLATAARLTQLGAKAQPRMPFAHVPGCECCLKPVGPSAARRSSCWEGTDNKALCWLSCSRFLLQVGQTASLAQSLSLPGQCRQPCGHPLPPRQPSGTTTALLPSLLVLLPAAPWLAATGDLPAPDHWSNNWCHREPFLAWAWSHRGSLATHPQTTIPKKEPHEPQGIGCFCSPICCCLPCPALPHCPPARSTADPLPRTVPARAMLHVRVWEGRPEAGGGRGGCLLGPSITSPARCRDSLTRHRALS